MFWGLIMEPNKRYTQVVEKPFHISQAAMDTSTGDTEPCQVMVVVENKNFLVCTLQKNKTVQVPLDLYFKTGDAVSFLINGKCNVHLTGYLDPEFEDTLSDDEEADEEEEKEPIEEKKEKVPVGKKRKLEANTNNANKKAKQILMPAEDSSDEDDDEVGDDTLRKILDGEDIDTDENDESFKINSSADASSDDDEDDDEDEDEEEDDDDEEEEDDDDEEKEAETTVQSKEEKVDTSKLSKSQKRRLKKKLQQQAKLNKPQVNGVERAKDKQDKKADKKKPEVNKEAQDGQKADKREKKTLSGGVIIEDTKVGNGPVAKPGKVVMVYYEGKLKENNKMFDNCMKGPGFKFRLGAKEVISGWDIGISGMKVGGKRKIICPPSMAYGAKGSPPAIPPNSTLVFEVELKNMK